MPAWRLGRLVGSLLVLAGLAVGGVAVNAGSFDGLHRADQGVVASSDAPVAETTSPSPEGGYISFGWTWD
jgi:hypothetical protein